MKVFFDILGIVVGIMAFVWLLWFLVTLGDIGIALSLSAVVYVFFLLYLVNPKHPVIAGLCRCMQTACSTALLAWILYY